MKQTLKWLRVEPQKISPSACVFLFFFLIYSATMSGWIQYGDEIEKYRVAQSIVERQQFSIRPTVMRNHTGIDGQTYSIYELGQSLLQVPLYGFGKIANSRFPQPDPNWIPILFVGLLNPLLAALTCVVFLKTCHALGFRLQTAFALTLALGLATTTWVYAKGFTREPLLTMLILATLYAAYLFGKTHLARWLLLAGACAGYLTFSKLIQAMVIPFILAYLGVVIFQECRRTGANTRRTLLALIRGLTVIMFPAFVFLVIQSIYALVRYGNWNSIGGTRGDLLNSLIFMNATSQPITATMGLLFSSDKSIFLYSPPIILFVFSWLRWRRSQKKEAWLVLFLVIVEWLSVITRYDWDGGTWWGPRYLVPIIPLLVLPVGFLLETPNPMVRKVWQIVFTILGVFGFLVQVVGVIGNERDYLDIMGAEISLGGQLTFLYHGAMDSLIVSLSPDNFSAQINPFGILAGVLVTLLGILMVRHLRPDIQIKPSSRTSFMFGTLVLVVASAGFIYWIVAPYSRVFMAKADTRYVAATRFLADGKTCQAAGLYLLALDRQTNFQSQAAMQIALLLPQPLGQPIAIDNPREWLEMPEGTSIEDDHTVTITGNGSTRFINEQGKDATVSITSQPITTKPDAEYVLSGWMKTEALYGTGYAVVTVFEDDGNWNNSRTRDLAALDETHGWKPFKKSLMTLPTTQRIFVKTGLYETYGTFWLDGLTLTRVVPSAGQPRALTLPCQG